MTRNLIAYAIALILFGAIDIVWISAVAAPMFQEALSDSLVTDVRLAPALVFYALFPAGLVYFAAAPALTSANISTALINGMLFGLFTYATYDLTNFATLRGWTLEITLTDIFYGAVVSGLLSVAAYVGTTRLAPQDARSR